MADSKKPTPKPMKLRAGAYKGYYWLAQKSSPKENNIYVETKDKFPCELNVTLVNPHTMTFEAFLAFAEGAKLFVNGEFDRTAIRFQERNALPTEGAVLHCDRNSKFVGFRRPGEFVGVFKNEVFRGGWKFLDNFITKPDLHNHKLLVKTGYSHHPIWKCSGCKKEYDAANGQKRYKCYERCGFKACETCFLEVTTHLHRHKMLPHKDRARGWSCARCRAVDPPKRYKCGNRDGAEGRCNFDLCEECVFLKPNPRKTFLHPTPLLQYTQFGEHVQRWTCSHCARPNQPTRFCCPKEGCHYDLCERCLEKSREKIEFSHMHPHALKRVVDAVCPYTVAPPVRAWICSHCSIQNQPKRFSCAEGCAYDLCDVCMDFRPNTHIPLRSLDKGGVHGYFADHPSYAQPTLAWGFARDNTFEKMQGDGSANYSEGPGPAYYAGAASSHLSSTSRSTVPKNFTPYSAHFFRSRTGRHSYLKKVDQEENHNFNNGDIFGSGLSSFHNASRRDLGPRLLYRGEESHEATRYHPAEPVTAPSPRAFKRTGVTMHRASWNHPQHLAPTSAAREMSATYRPFRNSQLSQPVHFNGSPKAFVHPQQTQRPSTVSYDSYHRAPGTGQVNIPKRFRHRPERRDTFMQTGVKFFD